ncbi:MAG TPA: hypothetical protein VN971_10705, partial [Thermoanaerobaculia bacterium]|nr:hypothetical protein [Thermoanaerobaculia bacterium]
MKSPSGTANGRGRNGNAIRSQTLQRIRREERDDALLDRRQLLSALTAFQKGSFDVRLPEHWSGIDGKIADAFNAVVERNQR